MLCFPDWNIIEKCSLENLEDIRSINLFLLVFIGKLILEKMISFCQMDGVGNWCECDKCKTLYEEEGSKSGTLIHFVNKLTKRFPNKVISTMAYLELLLSDKTFSSDKN